jgi:hypothetical protein
MPGLLSVRRPDAVIGRSVQSELSFWKIITGHCQSGALTMDDSKKTGRPNRSKINMHEEHAVRYWAQHLNVTKEELQRVVDKVGSSAAAVRKQLTA